MSNPEIETDSTRARFSEIPGPWVVGGIAIASGTFGIGGTLAMRATTGSETTQITAQNSSPNPTWDTGQFIADTSPALIIAAFLTAAVFAVRRLQSRS